MLIALFNKTNLILASSNAKQKKKREQAKTKTTVFFTSLLVPEK